ncbi:MAG: hypothetical protein ACR2NR_10255 [Solirubrobacteraceae bacterium]
MSNPSTIRWLADPEDKDYAAAESFLSMLIAPASLADVVTRLRSAPLAHWAAKDILRAAGLPSLKPKQSAEVSEKLKRIRHAMPISPVLAIGGLRPSLVIADGYHRVSAAYRVNEDSLVPGRLLWLA